MEALVYNYTANLRKVVGKSACDNLVHCFSKKFQRMALKAMDVCCEREKKATKVGLTATVSGRVYWSYPIYYLLGLSRAQFFQQPF